MSDSRLTPALELDGISPDEAFAVLGNEIRLDIVRVLWQADAAHRYDEVSDTDSTISFTELRRNVDIDDNGRFNYHLSQLSVTGRRPERVPGDRRSGFPPPISDPLKTSREPDGRPVRTSPRVVYRFDWDGCGSISRSLATVLQG